MTAKKEKEIYFKKDGLYVYTSHLLNGNAFLIAEIAVQNRSAGKADVWIDIHMHQLIDTGKVRMDEEPGIKAAGTVRLCVPAGECRSARTAICVENAVLWDTNAPVLYVVEAVLYKAVAQGEALPNPGLLAGMALQAPHSMKMLDFEETRFGIRTVSLDAGNGFCLNGNRIKQIGKSLSAQEANAAEAETAFEEEYRMVKAYKESGYNALKVKGSEISENFLDICSRLGVLVWNEITEEQMIDKDRNAPSVVARIIGEECFLRQDIPDMALAAQEFAGRVRSLDCTRPVGGMCHASFGTQEDGSFSREAWNDKTEPVCAAWDFVGYPDENQNYREAHALFPNRVIVASGRSSFEDIRNLDYIAGYFR